MKHHIASSSPNLAYTTRFPAGFGKSMGESGPKKIPEVSFLSNISAGRGYDNYEDKGDMATFPFGGDNNDRSFFDTYESFGPHIGGYDMEHTRGHYESRGPSASGSPQKQSGSVASSRPPIPPSIETARPNNGMQVSPNKAKREEAPLSAGGPLSANTAGSSNRASSYVSSIYYQAPNLVGLADPARKRSTMSLYEQGPAMIPSIVDLAEPIQHMGLGHLPEETSSKAVQNALRTLQEKVAKLEVERVSARDKIQSLEDNLAEARKMLTTTKGSTQNSMNSSLLRQSVSTNDSVRKENTERRIRCLEDELDATRRALEVEQHRLKMSKDAETAASKHATEAETRAKALQHALHEKIVARRMKEEVLDRAARQRESMNRNQPFSFQASVNDSKRATEEVSGYLPASMDDKGTSTSFIIQDIVPLPKEEFVHGLKRDVEIQVDPSAASFVAQSPDKSSSLPLSGATLNRTSPIREEYCKETGTQSAFDDERRSLNRSPRYFVDENRKYEDGYIADFLTPKQSSSLCVQSSEKDMHHVLEFESAGGSSAYAGEAEAGSKIPVQVEQEQAQAEKSNLEGQLNHMRSRAAFLERQLNHARDLQQTAQTERDELRRELLLLRHGIGNKEKRLSALNIPSHSPPLKSDSFSPGRSSRQSGSRMSSPGREGRPAKFNTWEDPIRNERNLRDMAPESRVRRRPDSDPFDESFPTGNDTTNSMIVENNSFLDTDQIERLRMEIDGVRNGAERQAAELLVRRPKGAESKMTRVSRVEKSGISTETRGREAAKSQAMHWKKLEGARPASRMSVSNERHSRSHSRSLRDDDLALEKDSYAREMPFVVGKNTGRSHSVTANLQKVFSMLKTHNPALCSVCSKRKQNKEVSRESSRKREPSPQARKGKQKSVASGASETLPDEEEFRGRSRDDQAHLHLEMARESAAEGGTEGLARILKFLESEHMEYKGKYHRLVAEYEKTADVGSQDAHGKRPEDQRRLRRIGDDLRNVIQDMDAKGDQIRILRDIITSSSRLASQQKTGGRAQKEKSIKGENEISKAEKELRRSLRAISPSRKAETNSASKKVKKSTKAVSKGSSSHGVSATGGGFGQSETRSRVSSGRSTPKFRAVDSKRRRTPSPARSAASLHLLRNSLRVQEALED
ncbi:hypothetical protein HDU67_005937 [Dinochytrium kinnereticum]|nr:hypothetical protein HDU67_005937 [Dinochytrium kinnereticum]